VRAYEVVLHERAWAALVTAKSAERRWVLLRLDELKKTPSREGDFKQRDESGRVNEVAVLGDWIVTFWTDHAVAEIRVVSLERVED